MSQELHSLTLPITSGGTTTPTEFSVDYLARKDGIVDTAENLMGDAENVAFTTRTVSGSGVSKTEKVSGNSLVWNQFSTAASGPSTTTAGVTYTYDGNGKLTINGTSTEAKWIQLFRITIKPEMSGHKVLLMTGADFSSFCNAYINSPYEEFRNDTIKTLPTISSNQVIQSHIPSGRTATNLELYPKLFDLTKMYGAGHEPTTVAQFKALFPNDYYAYEQGKVINNCTTGIKSKKADNTEIATLSLPITTLTGTPTGGSTAEVMFGDGMVSVGNVADELLPTGTAVKRFAKQTVTGSSGAAVTLTGCKTSATAYLCSDNIGTLANGVLTLTKTVSSVDVYYEKATPTEYTFAPLTDTLTVEDGGTLEQLVPTGTEPTSAPFKGRMRLPAKVNKPMVAVPAPSANGTYKLTCTVSNGVATYSWVSA